MLYLTCTTITSVDLAHYGVSRAKDWVSVDVGTMGSCYTADHIAEDHIHTDITIYYIEEPQQKYRLGTVINR